MFKYVFILLFAILLGCSNGGLSPKAIIEKCQKCEEQGMNVLIYSDMFGKVNRVECVPTEKQRHP
jgi:hypothetical protein